MPNLQFIIGEDIPLGCIMTQRNDGQIYQTREGDLPFAVAARPLVRGETIGCESFASMEQARTHNSSVGTAKGGRPKVN